MPDLEQALADIVAIRTQIARGAAFHGYGPAALAATGLLALATAAGQALWLDDPSASPAAFFIGWVVTGLAAAVLVAAETVTRSRRLHSSLADEMIYAAVEQFLPTVATGVLLGLVLGLYEPQALWMLPGLWQLLVGLGIFAASRNLPRAITFGGVWYIAAGLGCLAIASRDHLLSPWLMGAPFAAGQLLIAAILRAALGNADGQE